MNWSKLLGVGMVILGEVENDLKDGKLTLDEIITTAKDVVDKLGYGGKAILNFTKKDK